MNRLLAPTATPVFASVKVTDRSGGPPGATSVHEFPESVVRKILPSARATPVVADTK
jgi:hypothetical protein